MRRFAGGDALRRGQNPGVKPGGVKAGKNGQLLGTGGQQDIALGTGQISGGLRSRFKHGAALRQGALRPQQAAVFHARLCRCGADVLCGVHRVRVGGVDAQVCSCQQRRHGVRLQPPGVHGDARHLALFLGTQRGRHADDHLGTQPGQPPGKAASLGGAAEHDRLHRRYPRGVTIHPAMALVLLLPM